MSQATGFTRVELLAMLAVGIVMGAVGAVVAPKLMAGGGGASLQIRDATQQRAIVVAITSYASENNGRFPLPSIVDRHDTTVPEIGEAKNTTANIFSILLFQMLVRPESFRSPAEPGNVFVYEGYQYTRPSAAVNPALAQWDPAISADFTSKKGGNFSYAHLQPSAGRLSLWSNTMDARYPVLSNRGPLITGVSPSIVLGNPKSLTLKNGKWSGNVAYSDNHVSFEDGYSDPADNYFFDEPGDPANSFLGIFIKAGKEAADFTAIWD